MDDITYKIRAAVFEVNKVLGAVILELKAVERLDKMFTAQLLNYMKATGFRIGMLINFRYPKADIKRFILDTPEGR